MTNKWQRTLSRLSCEGGAALAYLAIFMFLLLIIAFGYQIDMSFTAASSAQGQIAMDEAGFGSCTNTYACEAECPKGISVANIAKMNRDYIKASFAS